MLNLDPVWGLPSFKGPNNFYEQGDTCANSFTLAYCGLVLPSLNLLADSRGWPVRSPDTSKWYGRRGRCSRDQLTPFLIYYACSSQNKSVWARLVRAISMHGFILADNWIRNHVYEDFNEHAQLSTPDVRWEPDKKLPDLLGPDIWAILLRALAYRAPWTSPMLYLLIAVLDLQNLAAVLLTAYQARCGSVNADQRNLALKVHFAANQFPTPISKLTFRLYKSLKPQKWFEAWWAKPGEPNLAPFMSKLFV